MRIQDSAIVLTGATSGIGKATALMFAQKGANLILAARNSEALRQTAAECEACGVRALAVPTDVRDPGQVHRLAEEALREFERIDAWVNDAGVYLLGPFEETPLDVYRQVIETNYFGVVYGSREAITIFRRQGRGVLINVSSVDGRMGAPYASAYASSKFAVRGLDEVLEQELLGTDIKVCTIMPSVIDTPIFRNTANYTGRTVKPFHPIYDPDAVARAIVGCIRKPKREVVVGGAGKTFSLLQALAPALFARAMKRTIDVDHFTDTPAAPTSGNINHPMSDGSVRGGWREPVDKRGLLAPALVAVPAALGMWFWIRRRRDTTRGLRAFGQKAGAIAGLPGRNGTKRVRVRELLKR